MVVLLSDSENVLQGTESPEQIPKTSEDQIEIQNESENESENDSSDEGEGKLRNEQSHSKKRGSFIRDAMLMFGHTYKFKEEITI